MSLCALQAGAGRKDTVKEPQTEREKKMAAMEKLFGRASALVHVLLRAPPDLADVRVCS